MDVTYNIHKQLMQNKKVTQKEPKGKLYSNADQIIFEMNLSLIHI